MGTFSAYTLNKWLDATGGNTTYTTTTAYLKLHLGDPGSDGTGNPAAETDRQAISFGAAAAGAMANDAAVTWTGVGASETVSWVSLWDASVAGNFLGRDQLAANAVLTAGDNFTIPVGDLDLTIT